MTRVIIIAAILFCRAGFASTTPAGVWIWAGSPFRPEDLSGKTLYLHQGSIRGSLFSSEGIQPHPLSKSLGPVLLTFRIQSLPSAESFWKTSRERIAQWELRGTRIAGVQLDFDSATAKLGLYSHFLSELRSRMRPGLRLSVTGLADWSTSGRLEDLQRLSGSVDEVVYQLYRGRRPLPGYERYIDALARLKLPFKIGILESMKSENAKWQSLASNENFRGAVVFLQSPARQSPLGRSR